jgi:hypothetical protein
MAELSAETQAIIERLKAEGQLVRNSGTNSIRSVKIQLDRFEGVFNTISANVVEQTKILQMQAGLAQEAVEAQRTKEQFDELQQEKEKESRSSDNGSETNKKIDDIGDKISSALSLKNLALAGAGLFVGYNLLKGFIDERTDGGFTRMEESIRNTDFAGLSTMVNALTSIDWQGFADIMNRLIRSVENFDEWLASLPGIILGGHLFRQGVRGMIDGALDSRRGNRGPRRGGGGGGPRGLGALRLTILGAVTSLAWAYGDEVEAYLRDQMGMKPDVAELTVDVAKYGLTAAAGAATLAAMFGMTIGAPGLILAAAAGVAFVLGREVYDWFVNQEERAAEAARERLRTIELADQILNSRRAEFEQLANDLATMTPEEQNAATEDLTPAETLALNNVITPIQEALEELNYAQTEAERMRLMNPNMAGGDPGANRRLADAQEYLQSLIGPDPETGEVDQQTIDALWALRTNLLSQAESMFDFDTGQVIGDRIRYDSLTSQSAYIDNLLRSMGAMGEGVNFFRTGTRGFADFGAGEFAVLHGREAVVPFNTAAGRFLDQYFTESWEPRVANQGRMETVASGAFGGGGAVVINAPTTVSPTITNVEGAKSVNQLSVRSGGGGMGSGSANPYGLPGLAN